ncbi:hypothetical protein [Pseudomonas matsuisoli]|uniref:Uncharacterized protein n=1 Tax=Pseudomonas matsuisoli TaxID=1515666 RepID=A0A917PRZ7_9PSED|nr:hypothetical protein [Pseudomonas matsuisoli]GGJ89427.1 hypothetical protein GCM10009304_13790 [Pseudomonas matsuisoli]
MPAPLDRATLLAHPDALECTVYRPDPNDADDEIDLGDALIVLGEPFAIPVEWDANDLEAYLGDGDEADFYNAWLEPTSAPGSRGHFSALPGDYVAATASDGLITMYAIHDCPDTAANLFIVQQQRIEL